MRKNTSAKVLTLNTTQSGTWVMSGILFAIALCWGLAAKAQDDLIRSYGYNFFGELSYPEDYKHFNYVNPDAPKGGEISIWASGTFDSMNPYSRKGRAGRLSSMMYESLLGDGPADTVGEYYGLLAHSLEYPASVDWVIFHMRPEARFSDGTPVTAHDVVFSHNLLLEQGLPSYAQAVKRRVPEVEALDDHTVKFYFAQDLESRRSLVDQVGGVPVWSQKWYEETGARLDESRLITSPGTGPYMFDSYDINRQIVYRRNPGYWGKDLPINQGRHNFDTIRVEYFADDAAAFEAFKAGAYTFRIESTSKKWSTGYDFPALENGYVVQEVIEDGNPPTPNGIVFNLQRPQFQDPRVREAFALAYNFEWTNETLQYGLFRHLSSFVQDTHLEAKSVPQGAELALLKSLGDIVPGEVFSNEPVSAHSSKPRRALDRGNLRKALALFEAAGWTVGSDGKLRNADGETLKAEFIQASNVSDTMDAFTEAYVQNLQKMGVDANVNKVDASQFTLRRREKDYDLIFSGYSTFLEAGTGLMQRFGSREAEFSVFNPASLASPQVDEIISRALATTTRDDQDVALTALDRVLRHERFMIPTWYKAEHWVAYFDMYEHPEEIPPYDFGVLDFWWYNAEKGDALRAAGALQ